MSSATATPQAILDRRYTEMRFAVLIDGIPTDAFRYSGQHSVDQATATATIEMDTPRPAHIVPNAHVEVMAGWDDLTGTIFSGRLPEHRAAFSEQGGVLTLRPVGWTSLLAYPDRWDLEFQGPISLREMFLSLCARRGVPSYHADTTTSPDGTTEIVLGANGHIDDGRITIPSSTTPLAFLNQQAEPYGYKVFDTPDGTVRLARISGIPVDGPVVTFTEGEHLERVERSEDISDIINYWDVYGAEYENDIGEVIPIRSIAAEIPYDPRLAPEGYRYKAYRNNVLTTLNLARAARARLEIDHSEAYAPVSWEAIGLPGIAPGDTVIVESPEVEASGRLWLMSMDLSVDANAGLSGRYTGWAGAGTQLAIGRFRDTYVLQTAPIHLGDEYVPWYAQPSPQGTERSWTFTIPERATAVNIRFWHHGTNSQLLEGTPTNDLQVSKWELWRKGADKAESSGSIPPVPEHYERRLPYGAGLTHWSKAAVNLRGTDAGEVTLKLIAGENSGAGHDDFEVQQVEVDVYGHHEPTLPKERD
jgi:hypothetical protein